MTTLRTLDGIDVAGKRVIVRADLNVPMVGDVVTDDARIRCAVPTLTELACKGATVVVLSHFGRPNGKVVADFSLASIRECVSERIGRPVRFIPTDWAAGYPIEVVPTGGEVVLIENTRFHPGEEANDPVFSRTLANLGDIFVNDAFSVSHRAHASTVGVAQMLPSFAGRNLQAELAALDAALGKAAKPLAAVIGGRKISTKLAILENLVRHVDMLFVGGGMANTLLHAQGKSVGRSICEPQLITIAEQVMRSAHEYGCVLVLPKDVVVADELAPGAKCVVVSADHVPRNSKILDIGPATVVDFASRLAGFRTLVWNGPVGAFEVEPFHQGTFALARIVANLTRSGSLETSVAGGGDTLAALGAAGVLNDFSYVSTGGGAFLEWLEGRELPGVAILKGPMRERRH
jgi:phosphoglycerate kinase